MAQPTIEHFQLNSAIPDKRNAIINGDFNIWQRGTTFTSITNNAYSTDRWLAGFSVTGSRYTITRSTDVPTVAQAGRLFNFSALCTVSIADASVGATDANVPLQQRVEGYNFLPLAQKPMILSFWVKSSLVGTYCVGLRNSIFDRSFVGEYTVSLANTWEFKTISVLASPSAGTWNYTDGHGIDINFTLMAGTTFQTTPNIWQSGNFFATSSQFNHAATLGNTFRITGVQLESGSSVSVLQQRSINEELKLCLRYYEKSYDLNTTPGANTGAGQVHWEGSENNQPGSAENTTTVPFSVRKRSTPTVVFYDAVGNINRFSYGSIHNTTQGSIAFRLGERSFAWQHDSTFGDTVGQNDLGMHYTADAEL